jgi:CrcB protein
VSPWEIAAVVVSGGFAAILRYGLAAEWVKSGHDSLRSAFPLPVLVVNVVGSLSAGLATAWSEEGSLSKASALVLLTGLAGGLTTFSTWGVETHQIVRAGRWKVAVASVGANLALGILFAAVGYALGGSGFF